MFVYDCLTLYNSAQRLTRAPRLLQFGLCLSVAPAGRAETLIAYKESKTREISLPFALAHLLPTRANAQAAPR